MPQTGLVSSYLCITGSISNFYFKPAYPSVFPISVYSTQLLGPKVPMSHTKFLLFPYSQPQCLIHPLSPLVLLPKMSSESIHFSPFSLLLCLSRPPSLSAWITVTIVLLLWPCFRSQFTTVIPSTAARIRFKIINQFISFPV